MLVQCYVKYFSVYDSEECPTVYRKYWSTDEERVKMKKESIYSFLENELGYDLRWNLNEKTVQD